MNLTIDIGNTVAKLAVFENNKIKQFFTTKQITKNDIIKINKRFKIDRSILSSVSKTPAAVIKVLERQGDFIRLSHSTAVPIKNKYKSPKTLGNDRLAVAVAASHLYPKRNVLVIDAGTCVTCDFINNRGHYLGGSISPGLTMRFKALSNFTSDLPLLNMSSANGLVGKDTKSSITLGIQNGILHEVESTIASYRKEFKQLVVLITGGDSSFFERRLKSKIFAVPDLVLMGLNQILLHNA